MEIVALNEQLRREFSPVLKLLRPQAPPPPPPPPPVSKKMKKQSVSRSRAPAKAAPSESATTAEAPVPAAAVDALPSSPAASPSSSPPSAAVESAQAAPTLPFPPLTPTTAADVPEKTPQQLVRIDRFKQHCLTVVHRLNTYQYGTKKAFCQEIAQLLLVARTPEQQQELQRLSERVDSVETVDVDPAQQTYGSLEFDRHASIPGLQEVDSETGGANKKWLCNVNIKEQSVPIGTYLTRENALKAYELFRFDLSTNRGGAASVYKLAEKLATEQRESDENVLQTAMSKCYTHVSWQRLQDMISLSTAPPSSGAGASAAGAAAGMQYQQNRDKEQRDPNTNALNTPSKSTQRGVPSKTPPSRVNFLSPLRSSSPPFSPQRTTTTTNSGAASSTSSTTSSTSTAKSRNPKRKKPAHRLAHLRLRRLIQKRLCPHLKGKEVCVIRSVHMEERSDWTPTGRLEAGKVFSYKHNKLLTFADYVAGEMPYPVSACPHIFLVKTRESIDDHLMVCDTFSDAERIQLGQDFRDSCQNYMNSPEPKVTRRR